jgi:hypothetical protein
LEAFKQRILLCILVLVFIGLLRILLLSPLLLIIIVIGLGEHHSINFLGASEEVFFLLVRVVVIVVIVVFVFIICMLLLVVPWGLKFEHNVEEVILLLLVLFIFLIICTESLGLDLLLSLEVPVDEFSPLRNGVQEICNFIILLLEFY